MNIGLLDLFFPPSPPLPSTPRVVHRCFEKVGVVTMKEDPKAVDNMRRAATLRMRAFRQRQKA